MSVTIKSWKAYIHTNLSHRKEHAMTSNKLLFTSLAFQVIAAIFWINTMNLKMTFLTYFYPALFSLLALGFFIGGLSSRGNRSDKYGFAALAFLIASIFWGIVRMEGNMSVPFLIREIVPFLAFLVLIILAWTHKLKKENQNQEDDRT